MKFFENKIAIVTGGASGIGKAFCNYLAQRNATVVIADNDLKAAQEVESLINSQGGKAKAVYVDVGKRQEVKSLIDITIKDFGKIDYLFNNAGIAMGAEFQDFTLEDWQRVLDINLMGTLYGCHYAYPIMMKQGYGHIINVSSLAGLVPGGLMTSYSASKYGVVGMTLTLRGEAQQYGIKVSALCPGYIQTPMHKRAVNVSDFIDSEQDLKINNSMNSIFRYPTAESCVNQMMRGVRRNKAIIVSPKRHKVFWWVERLFPAFATRIWPMIIKKMKTDSANQELKVSIAGD